MIKRTLYFGNPAYLNTRLEQLVVNILFSALQRYNLKAIHNKRMRTFDDVQLFSALQRYNLKAIHNTILLRFRQYITVFGVTKIQFESNSQLISVERTFKPYCFRRYKDTI